LYTSQEQLHRNNFTGTTSQEQLHRNNFTGTTSQEQRQSTLEFRGAAIASRPGKAIEVIKLAQ
jgi:hypothetical protein